MTPGSNSIVNAYTTNHELLEKGDVGPLTWLGLHMVDAVGIVHALILRAQALLFPIRTLVLAGH